MSQQPHTEQRTVKNLYGNLGSDPKDLGPRTRLSKDDAGRLHPEEVTARVFDIACQDFGDEKPEWVNCFDAKFPDVELFKGTRVCVSGYLRERSYTNKKTGNRVSYDQLVVTALEVMNRDRDEEVDDDEEPAF